MQLRLVCGSSVVGWDTKVMGRDALGYAGSTEAGNNCVGLVCFFSFRLVAGWGY